MIRSFRFAFRGIFKALKSERNLRVMLACCALVVALGFAVGISALEWCAVMLCCGGVLAMEMLNTAVECVVDMITGDYHELAEKAKDVVAGASLIFCVFSFVVGLIVFVPYIARIFQ